jgi:hypothetical protein
MQYDSSNLAIFSDLVVVVVVVVDLVVVTYMSSNSSGVYPIGSRGT